MCIISSNLALVTIWSSPSGDALKASYFFFFIKLFLVVWLLFWLINLLQPQLRCVDLLYCQYQLWFQVWTIIESHFYKLCRKSISFKIYYMHYEMTNFTIHQKVSSQSSPANFNYYYQYKQILSRSSHGDFMKYTYHELTVIFGLFVSDYI